MNNEKMFIRFKALNSLPGSSIELELKSLFIDIEFRFASSFILRKISKFIYTLQTNVQYI